MQTYSPLAVKLCIEFDEYFHQKKHLKKTKAALKEKTKLTKKVYYYGPPANNDCTEYFTEKSQIQKWIRKGLYVNFDLSDLVHSQLVLFSITINWQWTFHLTENGCKYFGSAFCADDIFVIPCLNYKIVIYTGSTMAYKSLTLCTLDFEGPAPDLQKMSYKDGITQFINIKWNNSATLPYKSDNDIKKIKCTNYLIRIFSPEDVFVVQIAPFPFNSFSC